MSEYTPQEVDELLDELALYYGEEVAFDNPDLYALKDALFDEMAAGISHVTDTLRHSEHPLSEIDYGMLVGFEARAHIITNLIKLKKPEQEVAEALEKHNKWRRGVEPYDTPGSEPFTPTELGKIIDCAVEHLTPCNCTFAQSAVGDGCRVCNPSFYFGLLDDEIKELERKIEEMKSDK